MSEARKRAGLKLEEVALKLGVGTRMLSRYEYGETTPSMDRLAAFAEIVGVPVVSLLSESVHQATDHGNVRMFKVPVITRIPASGLSFGFDDVPVEEWILTSVAAANAFALRAHGDSMSPRIDDGDLVICAPDQPFENNKIYAVVAGDSEHTLKTVQKTDKGFMLIPYNQNFEAIFVPDGKLVRLYKALKVEKTLLALLLMIATTVFAQAPKAEVGWTRKQFDEAFQNKYKYERSNDSTLVSIASFEAWRRRGAFTAKFRNDSLLFWSWSTDNLQGKIVPAIETSMHKAGFKTTSLQGSDDRIFYLPKDWEFSSPAYRLTLNRADAILNVAHAKADYLLPKKK